MKRLALAALLFTSALALAAPARAQGFLGWTPLAELRVGPSCTKRACEADVTSSWRHPRYAIATDAPLGASLTGRMTFVCEGGSEQVALLPSIPASGGVATVNNPCPGFAAKRATVRVDSASIPGVDGERGASLRVFGALN